MFSQFQSLDKAEIIVKKHFRNYPKASVSAMFRKLRKDNRFSLIGDYPIISSILSNLEEMGIRRSKQQVFYATRQSDELKGKTIILASLFNSQ